MGEIIDIGICTDNVDPKGIGRVRCKLYSEFTSSKEKAINFTKWSIDDPFVCSPFLPLNINIVPEIGQAVKIMSYNTDYTTLNREYIAGPFSNPHDFINQTYTKQLENTTYGVAVEKNPDIFNENGEYVKPETKGSLAQIGDFGLYGKYGSDIIFTENGVNIRGGKLLSKKSASTKKLDGLLSYPLMGEKNATISLKKFPKKATIETRKEFIYAGESKDLKYLVEYNVDSIEDAKYLYFYVYKITQAYGNITKTDNFNEYTDLPSGIKKLINTDNSNSTATHIVNISGVTNAHIEVNNFIMTLHETSLNKINTLYIEDDPHPFYYRPSTNLMSYVPLNENEQNLKINFLTQVLPYRTLNPQNGLIWSKEKISPTVKEIPKIVEYVKEHKDSLEQTFAAVKSDKIYLLSTDSNESDKNINFSIINKYEPTQEDYIDNIDKNTYSMVRGENLLNILNLMLNVLFDHKHNLTKPMAKESYDDYNKLVELIKNMENDILNKSIKIN